MTGFTNYFTDADVAARYARSRPDAHPQVIERIRNPLGISGPLALAVDVACGTGMSTLALRAIADRVIGVDPSEEMLAQVSRLPQVEWLRAAAEQLPLDDGSADLMTVCNGFHWFERESFLREAHRVLKPGAPLVVYEVSFLIRLAQSGTDEAIVDFPAWFRHQYVQRFPAPARGSVQFPKDEVQNGFKLIAHEDWNTWVPFSHERFVEYLSTQSNVVNVLRAGGDLTEIYRSLLAETQPFFASATPSSPHINAAFGGPIWMLRKV